MAEETGDRGLDPALATEMCVLPGDGGSVMPPIYQSSLFVFDDYQAFEDRMAGRSDEALYSRVQNPTVAHFESMIARAESAESAVGFASGMAAISAAIFAFIRPGDRLACVENVYPDAYRLFERLLRPFGIDITYHPAEALENDPDLLRGAALAYLESPNSLVLQPLNLPKVSAHAMQHGTLTIVDNSWATPVFQRPLESGVDLVVHSASKHISGHSDTVAGVVAGSAERVDQVRNVSLQLLGGKLAPFEAWLLIRGLRTLEVRMRQHQASANVFVDRLAALPAVRQVNSPGPNSTPGLNGRGGLMSVEFDDTVDIPRLADALTLFKLGVSWGGFESLVLPARVALAQPGADNSLQRFKVSPNLVRFSIGLEDVEDLWADFSSALGESAARRGE